MKNVKIISIILTFLIIQLSAEDKAFIFVNAFNRYIQAKEQFCQARIQMVRWVEEQNSLMAQGKCDIASDRRRNVDLDIKRDQALLEITSAGLERAWDDLLQDYSKDSMIDYSLRKRLKLKL